MENGEWRIENCYLFSSRSNHSDALSSCLPLNGVNFNSSSKVSDHELSESDQPLFISSSHFTRLI